MTIEQRLHFGAPISESLCSESKCWCWTEDRAKREAGSSNQIVAGLRKAGDYLPSIPEHKWLLNAAADEIERLTRALETEVALASEYKAERDLLQARAAQLTAATG